MSIVAVAMVGSVDPGSDEERPWSPRRREPHPAEGGRVQVDVGHCVRLGLGRDQSGRDPDPSVRIRIDPLPIRGLRAGRRGRRPFGRRRGRPFRRWRGRLLGRGCGVRSLTCKTLALRERSSRRKRERSSEQRQGNRGPHGLAPFNMKRKNRERGCIDSVLEPRAAEVPALFLAKFEPDRRGYPRDFPRFRSRARPIQAAPPIWPRRYDPSAHRIATLVGATCASHG